MTILIVEDDALQAKELCKYVYNVFGEETEVLGPFSKYKDTINYLKEYRFDMAILDIQLQEDTYAGVHIAETIEAFCSVPILFVSGISDQNILKQTNDIRLCNFIKKPFDDQTIERALLHTVASKQLSTEEKITDRVSHKAGKRDEYYWIKEGSSSYTHVTVENIVFVEVINKVCEFHMASGKVLIHSASLEKDIYNRHLAFYPNFYRLGRSYILNIDYVNSIEGNQIVYPMLENKKIRISRNQKDALFKRIGLR